MKTATFLCAVLATTAIAQPHQHGSKRRHVHGKHQKREMKIEWVYETVWETVYADSTSTVWVSSDVPSTSSALPTTSVPAQFFEPADQSSYTTLSTSTKPSAVASPIKESTQQQAPAPVPTTTSAPAPAPQTPTPEPVPTSTSVYVAPAPVPTTSTTPAPAPQPTTSQPAPASTSAASGGSGGGSGGTTHTGDLTYYAVGLGACGEDDSGKDNTENIVAVSHLVMGAQSNGNPYCGKKVQITCDGKTTTATVRDKCMGCKAEDIDVSEKAFLDLFGSLGVGRGTVEWKFLD
ncbi:RlpA-like double-psi beta-barrel-protein domain-containing protein-containing protein [Colletotrichum phormii]|uniref:RlpA-like double-psi beta-barrel-protein domain-containing protein-containing protein n=1 Tax=Colletotrichum phormii TaxID=359342 RepID=A0AAJ0EM67_9PEZI|nr:RlpA-like double-psi beta-barrel-protein domain-containing protein-containing protein [Colletotrichum phormii]KAK1654304.1 RlpA-like double-psi beta-barrel-protein domain-containing protein-containing protein [Colletotrichum phormii]